MFRNVASQKIVLLAIDTANNVPKTGDAANLTAYVSKDHGAVTVLGDTTATELDATNAPGLYRFDLTQGETDADDLTFSGKSATANIKLVPVHVATFPATGILAPTTSGRTLDVSAGGEAGIDWANVGTPSSTVSLSATTVATVTTTTTATTATNVTTVNGLAANVITAASVAADAVTEIQSGLATSAALATVQADTDDIQTRLPAALTGSGRMDSNVTAVGGTAAAATTLEEWLTGIIRGTADSGTTTTMVDAALTQADTDYFKGSLILFTSGTLLGQARLITGFTPGTDTLAFSPATTVAVATHDYVILPMGRVDLGLWLGSAPMSLISGRVEVDVRATGADVINAASLADDATTEIAAAVWSRDATLSQGQGTFGQVLGDSGADTDSIWSLANTNLNATVGSRASQTSVDTIDDFLDTEIAAIKAKTDSLTFTVANQIDANVIAMATNVITAASTATDFGTEIAVAVHTRQMTEAYAADGVAPTLEQMLYMLWSGLVEFAIASTTITCKKLDGTTTSMTFTLDSATDPTSRTRAT